MCNFQKAIDTYSFLLNRIRKIKSVYRLIHPQEKAKSGYTFHVKLTQNILTCNESFEKKNGQTLVNASPSIKVNGFSDKFPEDRQT